MEKLAIISNNSEQISLYLNKEISNIECTSFKNVIEFSDRVEKAPLRVDTLLILDAGLSMSDSNSELMRFARMLISTIINNDLLEIDRLIFINKTKNSNHLEVMQYFKDSREIQKKLQVIIYSEESYKLSRIKDLLMRTTVEYGTDVNYNYVIRKERGKTLKSKFLEKFETDKAILVEYPQANLRINEIKNSNIDLVGNEKLKTDIEENKKEIEKLDIELIQDEEIEEFVSCKIIGVVGESKSGCSTTAMILASTSSTYNKTLLIDLNYLNLGISYLTEKTLISEEFNEIRLDRDLIEDVNGIKAFKEKIYDARNLHILTNSLPVVKKLSMADFVFQLTNIVELTKQYYKTIIIDIPTSMLEETKILQNMLDEVILCSTPYLNNLVSLFNDITETGFKDSKAFHVSDENGYFKDVTLVRTNIFSKVHNNIKAVKTESIDRYSESILGKKLKATGIYLYSAKDYLDTNLYQQLIER